VAGYSPRALRDKLGIKPGMHVALLAAPDRFEAELAPLPTGVRVARRLGRAHDLVVAFTTRRAELERRWPALTDSLVPAGALWVAWPKKSAVKSLGLAGDMTEDVVRAVALPNGWVDVKVCAIDDTWSGLKCVRRVGRRGSVGVRG